MHDLEFQNEKQLAFKKKNRQPRRFSLRQKIEKNYGNEIDGETFFFEKCIVEKKKKCFGRHFISNNKRNFVTTICRFTLQKNYHSNNQAQATKNYSIYKHHEIYEQMIYGVFFYFFPIISYIIGFQYMFIQIVYLFFVGKRCK